jgi:sulfate adenylyltransferase subunit 1 (EFTu-like GTPase family)
VLDGRAAAAGRREAGHQAHDPHARALVKEMHYQLDVNTLHRDETVDALPLNGIDRVTLRTMFVTTSGVTARMITC